MRSRDIYERALFSRCLAEGNRDGLRFRVMLERRFAALVALARHFEATSGTELDDEFALVVAGKFDGEFLG